MCGIDRRLLPERPPQRHDDRVADALEAQRLVRVRPEPIARPPDDLQGAVRLARFLTRGPLPLDVVEKVEGGRLRVRTPPEPRTGLVEKILDPLDLIQALPHGHDGLGPK